MVQNARLKATALGSLFSNDVVNTYRRQILSTLLPRNAVEMSVKTNMIRVGFLMPANDATWLGGISYFRNLLGTLADFPSPNVEPVLLTGGRGTSNLPRGFEGIRTKALPSLQKGSVPWFARKLIRTFSDSDRLLTRDLTASDIRVLSHSGHLGRQEQVATVAWIPDFQHRYFPGFFSQNEIAAREREYLRQCQYATRVVLSSFAAQRDLQEFYPAALAKSRVLQFVANPPSLQTLPSREEIERLYKLPQRYFLLPNQFWKHKNHEVLLQALHILRTRGKSAVVVATGNTEDYRQPDHYPALMAYSRENGLEGCFRVLGVVPLDHLMGLMCNSVAVINPSRFEGWSTSVEEGKSMGKKILLSSIPAHIEQAPARAAYFNPDDSESLAELMSQALVQWDPGVERLAGERAGSELHPRRQAFATAYWNCVVECLV